MPPHPATFLKKNVIATVGYYDISYDSAADYEYFIRIFCKQDFNFVHADLTVVKMREGGISSSGLSSYLRTGREMNRAIKSNGYFSNILLIFFRLPIKLINEKFLFR